MRASYDSPRGNCLTVPNSWMTAPFWCSHGWLLGGLLVVMAASCGAVPYVPEGRQAREAAGGCPAAHTAVCVSAPRAAVLAGGALRERRPCAGRHTPGPARA
ncbi:hypothetical protein GCM10010216_39120 [Streptomyces flaveolus]|nr:hypothetical protein GCM10010216_39120 [Streptomyces flaveolus]